MATYSSHRLIMRKEEIDNFFCLNWKQNSTEMFIESSPTFQMTFVQIDEFDWLSGRQKGLIFVKCLKIFFSGTIRGMKPKLGKHA